MPTERIQEAFPNIGKEECRVTSEETPDYNCFAWVMGDKAQWWSPANRKGYYWRDDVPRNLEVQSFRELYKHEGGYLPCDHDGMEAGFEKIAIYAAQGKVTHVCKQTPLGQWSSKLGDWEDVEHNTLSVLEGEYYGKVVQILKRAVS